METLSSAVVANPPPVVVSKTDSFDGFINSHSSPEHAKAKEEALKKSVSDRVEMNLELEQAKFEGVDEKEWEE